MPIVFQRVIQGLSVASQNLVTIRMKPDESGRFGFNVKVRQILSTSATSLTYLLAK